MGHLIQQESINETTVSVIESRNEMEPGYKGWSPFMDERNRATRACVKTIVIFFIKYRKFLKSVGQKACLRIITPHNLCANLFSDLINMSRHRAWTFTINNDTFDDLSRFHDYEYFTYLIFGFERGEKKGTRHIQGYCVCHQPQSRKTLSKIFPRACLEAAKGTAQHNYTYCTKEGDFYEYGTLPSPGRRTDIDSLVTMISSGATRKQIQEQYPKQYFLYKKKIEEMIPQELEDKQRLLSIIPDEERFIKGAFIDMDISTYENEKEIVLPAYHSYDVEAWSKGFPPKIRRGYEIIRIDPDHVYVTYKDPKEYNYLIKKYQDIIDDITKPTEKKI